MAYGESLLTTRGGVWSGIVVWLMGCVGIVGVGDGVVASVGGESSLGESSIASFCLS